MNYKKQLKEYQKYQDFIEDYVGSSNAATGSKVDANANVEQKNLATMTGEMYKGEGIGVNRLRMYNKLTEMYGKDVATEYLDKLESHILYTHDETNVLPYCVSITMYPFLFNGLKTLGGTSHAPNNLDSFIGGFINLCFAVAAQFAGAVSTPEFLSYMDYFIRKDYGDDYYLHPDKQIDLSNRGRTIDDVICDKFSQAIYSLNQPAGSRNGQSIFWNIAYFDKPYFEGMFENFVFPDGTTMKWESVSWLQKRFMKWFNHERTKEILTFPVETLNLLDDGKDYVDQEWADFAAEMLAEGHSFFQYRSNSVDSLASCCFDGSQLTHIRVHGKEYFVTFKDLYTSFCGQRIETFCRGEWKKAKVIKLPMRKMYKVVLDIGWSGEGPATLLVTDNHLNPTISGLKETKDLNENDLLEIWDAINEKCYAHIRSIEDYESDDDGVYCFKMEDKADPYFTLANGVTTHNCRLRNELQDNTFSYTLGAGGVSTGSKCVMTLNMNHLIQEAVKNGQDIKETVRENVLAVHKYLLAYDALLKDFLDAHMLPVYDAGYISLDKQFLTIGINGLVEAAEFLGYNISPDDEGYVEFIDGILSVIYQENKAARTKEIMFNTEYVPSLFVGTKN